MKPLTARLDGKTGLRVLCGANLCRGELARVAVVQREGREIRLLCMLDGWKRGQGGRWMLSSHAVRRLAGAQSAVDRGLLAPELLTERGRPAFRRPIPEAKDANRAAYGLVGDNHVLSPPPSGTLADCRRCGKTNALTAEALRLDRA